MQPDLTCQIKVTDNRLQQSEIIQTPDKAQLAHRTI